MTMTCVFLAAFAGTGREGPLTLGFTAVVEGPGCERPASETVLRAAFVASWPRCLAANSLEDSK